ncbi:chloride channel K [Gouania willdenowi]|uniref:chloride channel K n=1 Tax=Gouania willdenowi TaxID=441366 RepID=UPI0010568152|nr:chloride channel protein ClC-Ka [Gouania willdenowi]
MQTHHKDTMRNLEESHQTPTNDENTDVEQEKPSKTSHQNHPFLSDSWRPSSSSCVTAKEWLLGLGAVCGGRWYAYATLGISTAILSFLMDFSVTKLIKAHLWLYVQLHGNTLLQFLCWTLYPACLCAFASSFSYNICPFSTGSGIPEVRAMLAGIEMPQYLSLTNMFVKFLGLICTLAAGSTVFLGKVGPFVHLSTMLGAYLNKLCKEKDKGAEEMLAAAAAVGVSSCFGAPISGVLFSMEIMSSHFALRYYCPCFFAAACGAVTFNLLSVWSGNTETFQALFKTNFPTALPFFPLEILLFAFLGLLCGAASCCYLICHRWILSFTKTNPTIVSMLTTQRGLYSSLVVFLLASLTFPHSVGRFMVSKYTMKQLLTSLLESRQWSFQSHNASVQTEPLLEWSTSESSVWLSLCFFLLMKIWMLVLTCSLPLPAGYFMPVFIWGAAMGRLLGEGVSVMMMNSGYSVNPGGYALAGAAAFSGAVTHTLSPVLVAVELTGQFTHAVPVLIATLLANGVARCGRRPSFYDAISISKRLPHLPSLNRAYPGLFLRPVGQVLRGQSVQLEKAAGPVEIQHLLSTSMDTHIPVVDSHESQVFVGFVLRSDLLRHSAAEGKLNELCSMHPASVVVSPHSTVQQAHSLLSLLGNQTLFVVDRGRLVGHITQTECQEKSELFWKQNRVSLIYTWEQRELI